MATSFKTLLDSDIINSRNYLHESVPITGTIVSGTYNNTDDGVEYNIKNYGHGMFQSVYDYPYLSSSANHIFDLTVGMHSSTGDAGVTAVQRTEKINMYNQMAQMLVGYDATGSIKKFTCPNPGAPTGPDSIVLNECIFMPFSRLLVKDEIKKGTFSLDMYVTGNADNALELAGEGAISGVSTTTGPVNFSDTSGSTNFYTNSPAGEYGVLYNSNAAAGDPGEGVQDTNAVGLIYYQAGIAVLSADIFAANACGNAGNARLSGSYVGGTAANSLLLSGSIINYGDAVRHRMKNVSFNNTTELNSTIYFARANANEFNYSSNPTYLSESKIQVKDVATDPPVSYITSVGLYGTNNELLATAKLSEPLKKTPSNEFTLRVRLDY